MKLFTPIIASLFATICSCVFAQEPCSFEIPSIPSLPGPLSLVNEAQEIGQLADGAFEMAAPGGTNLFNAPDGVHIYGGAPMLLFAPEGDFTLVARIDAKLVNVYDVAALVLYADEANWAKLCFEFSAEKEATVVSVITHGVSDDCNSEVIPDGDHVFYAICRKGAEYSFHWSQDGVKWRMVRHFRFESATPVRAGFAVHTPSSAGMRGRFSEIRYWNAAPGNMRRLDLSKLPQ